MANEAQGIGAGALGGAGTGALIGSAFPGVGTAIGAGLGALAGGALGFFGARSTSNAADAQRAALSQAVARLQQLSQQQYAQRQQDLQNTMAFYGPSASYLQTIYGNANGGAPGSGGAAPSGWLGTPPASNVASRAKVPATLGGQAPTPSGLPQIKGMMNGNGNNGFLGAYGGLGQPR